MALDTYSSLKTAVATWLHRADLASYITDFVTLAEERISRDLANVEAMWVQSSPIALAADDVGCCWLSVQYRYSSSASTVTPLPRNKRGELYRYSTGTEVLRHLQ